ncbi:MAG: hypothetical protein ACM31D_15315 [Bacteroidota bacterium]
MAEIVDLRAFLRTSGENVFALLGTEVVEVLDISVAGIRIARPQQDLPNRNVEFLIIPRSNAGPDFRRSVPVRGHIVGSGPDQIRIAFSSVTTALAQLIGCYRQDTKADSGGWRASTPLASTDKAAVPL